MTVEEFNKLVDGGCAACSGVIWPAAASDISWLQDGRPICAPCVALNKGSGSITH